MIIINELFMQYFLLIFLNSGFTLKFISFSFTFCHSDVLQNTRDNMQIYFVIKYLFFFEDLFILFFICL